MDTPHPLTDNAIKRRMFSFFRFHGIPYKPDCGNFLLGSSICNVANGSICVYFPRIGKNYGNTIYFHIHYDDPYNSYLRLCRRHNQVINAFPLAKIKLLPDLFD